MAFRIIIFVLSLVLCALIPLYYFDLLHYMVSTFGSGWVFTTLFLRILVVVALTIGFKYLFSIWPKTAKMKTWVIFLIALLPGLGISFIAPIYEGDYGLEQYGETPINIDALTTATNGEFEKKEGNHLLAFFDTGCPHCQATCKKLGVNVAAGQETPVTVFFPGTKEGMDAFLAENNGDELTGYTLEPSVFLEAAGRAFPSTFLIDAEGKTVNHWVGDVINYSALDYLLDLE